MNPFGDLLLSARTKKKWTLRQLAQKTSINRMSLSQYERGKCQPMQRGTVERLAQALDITLDTLLSVWHPILRERIIANGKIWCSSCREWKDQEAFSRNASSPSGYRSWCQECNSRRQRNYKQWTHVVAEGVLQGNRTKITDPPRKAYKPFPEDYPDPVWCQFERLPAQWFSNGRLRPSR